MERHTTRSIYEIVKLMCYVRISMLKVHLVCYLEQKAAGKFHWLTYE